MKFCTFSHISRGEKRPGLLTSDGATIVDLGDAFPDVMSVIKGGDEAKTRAKAVLDKAEHRVALGEAKLHAPVGLPEQIRDSMLFEKHVFQARKTMIRMRHPVLAELMIKFGAADVPKSWFEMPIYYKSNRFSVNGPEGDVIWPRYSHIMDFELEFGFFLGKKGKNIKPSEAFDHIFGFTIFNDFSARDAQGKEMQSMLGPCKGKDFDTGNSMGPFLVTLDEIGDPYSLRMQARVNGETWCDSNSRTIHHKFEDLLARVSSDETVHPGEFFGSGTVGDGCGLEHNRYLKDGDVVELEVEKIGILRNRVIRQK